MSSQKSLGPADQYAEMRQVFGWALSFTFLPWIIAVLCTKGVVIGFCLIAVLFGIYATVRKHWLDAFCSCCFILIAVFTSWYVNTNQKWIGEFFRIHIFR